MALHLVPTAFLALLLLTTVLSTPAARKEVLRETLLNLTKDSQCISNDFMIEQYLQNLK